MNYKGVPIHGVKLGVTGAGSCHGGIWKSEGILLYGGGRTVYDVSADLELNQDGVFFVLGSRPDEIDQLHLRGGAALGGQFVRPRAGLPRGWR